MQKRMLKALAAVVAVAGSSSAVAGINVIEGFENAADPAAWSAVSPSPQTLNAANPSTANTPLFTTASVTQGVRSGLFQTTWTLTTPGTATNPYRTGGPTTYWGIRYNVSSPSGLASNSVSAIGGLIKADVFNANSYPVQVALVFNNASSTGLERGPLQTIPANSAATYTWDFAATPPTGWVTGNGAFETPTVRLITMLVYYDQDTDPGAQNQPNTDTMNLYVDNIRDENAQTDTQAPAVPSVLQVRQGSAAGKALVSWLPNSDPDLASYKVYVAQNSNFGSPSPNRLTFPTTATATVAAGTNQVEIDVPTTGPVYIGVSAVDNATPLPNESSRGAALAVSLRPDGASTGNDLIVLDQDRNVPGVLAFTDEGYAHAAVYSAQALSSINRYFGTAMSYAFTSGSVTLTTSSQRIVWYSNLLDGNASTTASLQSTAITTDVLTVLTNYVNAGGKLVVSGAGHVEDLVARGTAGQDFVTNVMKASLVTGSVGQGVVTASGSLPSFAAGTTNNSSFNNNGGAFGTTSNQALSPVGGSEGALTYSGYAGAGFGAILNNRTTVLLGFALESLSDSAAATTSLSAAQVVRQQAYGAIVSYLTNTVADAKDWSLYE